jgi:hypothetical protein
VAALNAMPALSFMCSPDPPERPKTELSKSSASSTEQVLEKLFINAQGASSRPSACNVTELDASVMGASFVGRESDAISDLAALADMSVMAPLSPRQALLEHHDTAPGNSMKSWQQQQQQQAQPQPPSEICGVGVILEQTLEGTGIIVEKVFAGGPADVSGLVHEGDEIISVDHAPINGRTPSQLKRSVVGPAGTTVILGIRRRSGQTEMVALTRGATPPQPDDDQMEPGARALVKGLLPPARIGLSKAAEAASRGKTAQSPPAPPAPSLTVSNGQQQQSPFLAAGALLNRQYR